MKEGSDRLQLGCYRKPREEAEGSDEKETWVPLIDDVSGLRIRYFDMRLNAWVERWTDTGTLPRLIELIIERPNGPDWRRSSRLAGRPFMMTLFRLKKSRGARAAAILLALWALFLLSAMVISWALDINTRLTISGSANRLLEAEAMACSGAEIALHPAVKPARRSCEDRLRRTKVFRRRSPGKAAG